MAETTGGARTPETPETDHTTRTTETRQASEMTETAETTQPTETTHPGLEMPEAPRRRVSVGHLVMGLVFLGLSLTWLLREGDVLQGEEFRWAVPALFVVAGAAGLAVTLGSGLRRR